MKRLLYAVMAAGAVLLFVLVPAKSSAAINPMISFQGKLTNTDGTNVTDGNFSIRFRIYTDPSADTGSCANTCKWEETQGTVAVSGGLFHVNLGSVTTLPGSVDFNNSTLYLGVKVASDAEMTPRIRLTAVPQAFNSDLLDGLDSSALVQLSPGSQQTGNINVSGTVTSGAVNGITIGSTIQPSSTGSLTIQSTGANALTLNSGSGTLVLGASTLQRTASGTTTFNLVDSSNTILSVTNSGAGSGFINADGGYQINGTAGISATCSGGQFLQNQVVSGGLVTGGTCAAGGSTSPAGSNTQIQFNNSGSFGADADFLWNSSTNTLTLSGSDTGLAITAITNEPSTPASGTLRIYTKDVAGRILPKWVGPSGVDTPFQASMGFNRVSMIMPAGGTTLTTFVSGFGTTFTNTGTANNPTPTTTNLLTSTRRATFSTGATAGTVSSHRQSVLQVWRGNAAGRGGFFYTTRFGTSTLASGNRAFIGIADSVAAPTNVDPTTNTTPGKIGLAINASTGNWNLVNNVTGTAPTVANLGASFPVNTTDLYELVLFSPPNGSTIGWRVTNVSTGAQTSGSLSTNIPSNTTFLAPLFWITNNATAAAAIIDFGGWYLESDY